MGIEGWCRDRFGGTAITWKALAVAALIIMVAAATSRAGDISGQPADALSVTNSVTGVTNSVTNALPQAAGVAAPAPPAPPEPAPPPPPAEEESWLSGLHISGYGSQTFGMWQNPPNLVAYTSSRNNLAVARSLLQIDGNYRLNENNTFFTRGWFVYEPPYAYNSGNNLLYAARTNYVGPPIPGIAAGANVTNPFCNAITNPKCFRSAASGGSYGARTNGIYNTYELRDAWWENKTGPLTTFVGNQIVVWGQSIAFRVGDVINPQNNCWAFGFANLEQSRVAQWMVHPILNLPEWGPLTSNFLELVVLPGFQPNWQPQQYDDPYRKYRSALTAGRANPCLPSVSHDPSGRFDIQYPTVPVRDNDWFAAPHGPYATGGNQTALGYNGLVTDNGVHLFWLCSAFGYAGAAKGNAAFNPYAAYTKRFPQGFPCNLGLSKRNNKYVPRIGNGSVGDIGYFQIPGMQPENWNEGLRFHTLYGATEWTALYYYDSTNGGNPATARWKPFTSLFFYQYPAINEFAVTVDRPVPAPASIAEYFPAVFRGEYLYQNHTSVTSSRFQDMNGQRWSDISKYMLALDLDQAYAPWLTSTGNLSANLEMVQTTVMDNCKQCWVGNDLNARLLKNSVQMLFNVGTSWWWSDFSPTWTMIYDPKGTTFALFPSLVLNPPWTKKYFMKLQAIEIMGGDKTGGSGIGLFKGQSYLLAQFQYNFNLM